MLFDIRARTWSERLLSDLAIPRAILPEVVDNSGMLAVAEAGHLGVELPVTGAAGDQQAALFGQACFRPGEAKNTYGTGSFLLMNTGREARQSEKNLLSTIAWSMSGKVNYALEGAIFVTGAAVQWLRDGLRIISDAAEIEALAASVPDSGGVCFVPALTGLGAPHWDQHARGTITGITRGTTAAHIARATLEAIALQSRDVLEAMAADSGVALRELRVDGGATRNDLLMQIQADVLGVPVVRPAVTETTALGAAYLAGLATGVWSGLDDVAVQWREERRFEPTANVPWRDELIERWTRAVERSRDWAK
jgi:glycerol kinase